MRLSLLLIGVILCSTLFGQVNCICTTDINVMDGISDFPNESIIYNVTDSIVLKEEIYLCWSYEEGAIYYIDGSDRVELQFLLDLARKFYFGPNDTSEFLNSTLKSVEFLAARKYSNRSVMIRDLTFYSDYYSGKIDYPVKYIDSLFAYSRVSPFSSGMSMKFDLKDKNLKSQDLIFFKTQSILNDVYNLKLEQFDSLVRIIEQNCSDYKYFVERMNIKRNELIAHLEAIDIHGECLKTPNNEKKTLLYISAPWCGGCHNINKSEELKELGQMDSLNFIVIHSVTEEQLKEFKEKNSLDYFLKTIPGKGWSGIYLNPKIYEYSLNHFPYFILLNKEGVLVENNISWERVKEKYLLDN